MSVVGEAWVHVRPELSGFPGELTTKVSEAVQGASAETKTATAEMSAAWDRLEAAEARAAAGAQSAAAAAERLTVAQGQAAAAAREQTTTLIGSEGAAARAAEAQSALAAAEERAGLAAQAAAAKQAALVEAQRGAAAAGAAVTAEAARSGTALEGMAAIGQKVAIGVAAGLGIAGVAAVKLANDFDVSQRQMQAQGAFTETQAADIGKAFLSTGGQVTFSAQQMMDAFGPVAGQLNQLAGHTLSAKEALDFERNAVNLAEASHLDLKTTTAALANVMQAFGISVGDAGHAADVLQNASRLTNVPLDQLTIGVDRLHAKLGPLSPTLDDTATLMSALSEAGLKGTRAVQVVIPALDKLTGSSKGVTDELAKLNVHVTDSDGKFVGMGSVIEQLRPKLAGMTEEQQKATLSALFGSNVWGVFSNIIMKGADSYNELGQKIGTAGAAQKAAETNTSSLRGESEKFLAGMKDLGVELGQFLVPILKTLVSGLSDTVNFFKQNEAVAIAVGAALGTLATVFIGAYLITKIQGLITILGEAKLALLAFGDTAVVEGALSKLGLAFSAAGSGAAGLVGGLTTIAGGTGAAIIGLGALTIAAGTYVGAQQSINDSNKTNEASFKQWANSMPHGSFEDVTASLHQLNGKLGENQTSWIQDAQAMVGFTDQTTDTARAVQSGVGPVRDSFQKISDATKQVAQEMGLTNDQAFALLRSLNIDWSKTSIQDAVTKLHQSLQATAAQTGTTEGALQGLAAVSQQTGRSVQDLVAAEDKAGKSAADAFTKATDVVSAFAGKLTTAGDIRKWYADQTKAAETFSTDIQKAMAMHLDPQLISRLLTAGPQQAGPVLHALVTGTDADFAKMVNDSEGKFREMSAAAAEMARLTQRAISGGTQQWSMDLATAMDASQRIMAQGGDKSVRGLMDALHVGGLQLARTLGEYGITFQLSADEQARIAGLGGQRAADDIAARLRDGRPLTQDELALFDKAFSDNANAAAGHGDAAGTNFADMARGALVARYGGFSQTVRSYDDALNQGLSPIAAAVGATGSLRPITIPGLIGNATGGVVKSMSYFAGEEGAAHPEFVLATNPAYRARNLGLFSQAGKALGVPGFAEGGFTDPSQVPKPPDAALAAFGVIDSSFGHQGDAFENKIYQEVLAFVTAKAAAAAAAGSGIGGSGPPVTGDCSAGIAQGLALPGANAAFGQACMEARIMNESGCRDITNTSDINAQLGHPSIGPAQFVPSTFASVSCPGCTDPHNLACAVCASSHCSPGNCGHGGYGCAMGGIPSLGGDCGCGGEKTGQALAKGGKVTEAVPWVNWLAANVPNFGQRHGDAMYLSGLGYPVADTGGIMPPGGVAVNTSSVPELILPGNAGASIFGLMQSLVGGALPAGAGGPTSIDASVHIAGNADAGTVAWLAQVQSELVRLIRAVLVDHDQAAMAELAARGIHSPSRLPGAA